jgi:hypothetical protein
MTFATVQQIVTCAEISLLYTKPWASAAETDLDLERRAAYILQKFGTLRKKCQIRRVRSSHGDARTEQWLRRHAAPIT